MDESEPLVAGVELGGTKCIAVLARGTTILAEERVETGEGKPTIEALRQILANWQRSNAIRALGIASFGPIMLDRADDNYGRLMGTPKPGWQGLDVSRMADGFEGKIAIDTDVNAAALAEWRWGGGAGLDIIAYLTIGTGIGGGLLANGRLVHGLLHPEMGHVMVRRIAGDDFPGVCKIHGDCLEGLASGPAISARAGMDTRDMPPDHPAWQIAGRKIWNWGVKHLHIRDRNTIAKELLAEPRIATLIPAMKAMPAERIAVIGHSFTMDQHWSSPSSFVPIVTTMFEQEHTRVEFRQWQAGGLRFARAYRNYYADALAWKPNVVLFVLGNSTPADAEALKTMAAGFHAAGARVLMFDDVEDSIAFGEPSAKETEQIARNAGVQIIPSRAILDAAPGHASFPCMDGIHKQEPYHRLMAYLWLKAVLATH